MAEHMKEINLVLPPEVTRALHTYYLSNSPAVLPQIPDDLQPSKLAFEKISAGAYHSNIRPEIANVNVTDLDQDGKDDALVCDNYDGTINWLRFQDGQWSETKLAEAPSPVHTTVFDYEGDGDLDIAVAVMGFLHPNDWLIGEAHLLLNRGDQTFEQIRLVKDVARITDVEPGDFDGDGDLDFAVAMYGWRRTGGLAWLEQVAPQKFTFREILPMAGVMYLQAIDFDGDGRLEIAALITQQHEFIAEFSFEGEGKFKNRIIARANHPLYGSSGFEWVDLDQDGDMDFLYTNGDMMDVWPEVKPYHGVRWFENQDGKFQLRHLAAMPGCYCARAYDMEGDGDLDVVVSNLNFFWKQADFPSLIWLENDGKQNFTRRRIAYSPVNMVSCDAGDLNHDGLTDIIGGGLHVTGPQERIGRITVWLGRPAKESPAGGGGSEPSLPKGGD